MTPQSQQCSAFQPGSALYRPPQHHFRGSLGRFATGVAVVTFDSPRGRHGLTVNSFTSVSMEPPLVQISLQRTVRSHDLIRGVPFTVNVLGAEQEPLAWQFAGRPAVDPVWIDGEFAPRLAGTLSYFECTPWAEYDAGDHTLFLGEVRNFDYRQGDALGFINGRFTTIPESAVGHELLF